MGKFSLLKGYLHYWLHAVNRHSLHAPFIYDFYTQIINNDHQVPIFCQIEKYRQLHLQDHSVITVNSPGATSHISKKKRRKISSIANHSLSSAKFSRLLYRLVSRQRPRLIIELGTSLGINTLYLSAAYPDAIIYTFEGCTETAKLASQLFKSWSIDNISLIEGNIDDTLPDVLTHTQNLDVVYMDANHRYAPTLAYYEMLYAKSHQESIFILDDIYWSSSMRSAWKQLKNKNEVTVSLDLFDAGLLLFKPMLTKQHHALMF